MLVLVLVNVRMSVKGCEYESVCEGILTRFCAPRNDEIPKSAILTAPSLVMRMLAACESEREREGKREKRVSVYVSKLVRIQNENVSVNVIEHKKGI